MRSRIHPVADRSHFNQSARLAGLIARRPRESVGLALAVTAILCIFVNALFLQTGPHPAPIFARIAPAAVAEKAANAAAPRRIESQAAATMPDARPRAEIVRDIQRELSRRGYYDGATDGVWGGKTDAAARDFAQAAGLKVSLEASEELLAVLNKAAVKPAVAPAPARQRPGDDPMTDLLVPSKRLMAVQRALADYGYGQVKPTGLNGPDTQAAIEKFERDHRMPVTGQVTDRLLRELAAMTGRPLD